MIQAAHYGKTERALALDPIVQAMARGLAGVNLNKLTHDGTLTGTPRFEFMQGANVEYRSRGGVGGGHIGAVAHALLLVLVKEQA